MTDINTVVVVGRVTRDISEKDFAYFNNNARLNFSIAVNRSYLKGEEWENETSFFDVTLWGKAAESVKKNICKGKQYIVEGSLKQDRWEKDGQKFSKVYIQADRVQATATGEKKASEEESGFTPKATESAPEAIAENNDIPF